MGWKSNNPGQLKELRQNLEKLKVLLQAEKVKEIEKLQRVVGVFDQKTQDAIRKETGGW